MSSRDEDVRSWRRARPRRVAVTRAGSPLGAAVVTELRGAGAEVVGVERRSGAADDLPRRLTELTSPAVVDALRDIDALVHLAHAADLANELAEEPGARRTRLIREMQTLTVAAAAAGVSHLVVVTSAMVFGARPDNPVPIAEDSTLVAPDSEGLVADLVDVGDVLRRARDVHPGLRVTEVRPAAVVGPGIDNIITRHFEAPRLLVLRGFEQRWQFCHVTDLGRAVATVLAEELGPVVAVGAPGSLSQAEVERLAGLRHISVAPTAAHAAAERFHRLGLLPLPATDLAYVSHPWVIDPRQLLEHGWTPVHDNASALAVLGEEIRGHHALLARRVQRKDALGAAGAASAAVAVVATAALLRSRRKRR